MRRLAVLAVGEVVWAGFGLLAQNPTTDPISGGAGWVGAGLLGLVLAWLLLKHLPDKDRQLADKDSRHAAAMADKDRQLNEIIDKKIELILKVGADFKADLQSIREHCEKEVDAISRGHQESITRITDSWRREIQTITAPLEKIYQLQAVDDDEQHRMNSEKARKQL